MSLFCWSILLRKLLIFTCLHFIYIIYIFKHEFINAQSVIPTCECGVSSNAFRNRIVGGANVYPNEYPWIVGIFDSNNDIYCGGSIISNLHILSAGHCVYYTDPYRLHAIVGMHDRILRDGVRYDFIDILIHPDFRPHEFHDASDISIIKVNRPIMFSQSVSPICLPISMDNKYDNRKATVAGWGRMWYNGRNSRQLQETKVIVQPKDQCLKTHIGFLLDPDSMICAYAKNADACQGDSGGPLFTETSFNRFEQFGVISFGIGCGTENSPGIYSRITKFLPWIRTVIADGATCQDRDMTITNFMG